MSASFDWLKTTSLGADMHTKNIGLPKPAVRLKPTSLSGKAAIAACAIGLLGPMGSHAQQQEKGAEGAPLEEIVITGSRIKRANLETASPITALPQEEFKYQGTSA